MERYSVEWFVVMVVCAFVALLVGVNVVDVHNKKVGGSTESDAAKVSTLAMSAMAVSVVFAAALQVVAGIMWMFS